MIPPFMPHRNTKRHLTLIACVFLFPATWARADDDDIRVPPPTTESRVQPGEPQFGLFGLLDKRSKYYDDGFPEPLRVEDTAVDNEFRLDWVHSERRGASSNQ